MMEGDNQVLQTVPGLHMQLPQSPTHIHWREKQKSEADTENMEGEEEEKGNKEINLKKSW